MCQEYLFVCMYTVVIFNWLTMVKIDYVCKLGNGDLKLDECSQEYTDMLLGRDTTASKQPSRPQDATNSGKH